MVSDRVDVHVVTWEELERDPQRKLGWHNRRERVRCVDVAASLGLDAIPVWLEESNTVPALMSHIQGQTISGQLPSKWIEPWQAASWVAGCSEDDPLRSSKKAVAWEMHQQIVSNTWEPDELPEGLYVAA